MNFAPFIEILFPRRCLACGQTIASASTACCETCRRNILLNPPPVLSLGNEKSFPVAATRYENPIIQKLIHHLKFNGIKSAATPLGEILAEYVLESDASYLDFIASATIIPIPLAKKRERHRGFNQSTLIAQAWNRSMQRGNAKGIVIKDHILARIRNVPPQSKTASAEERRENIRGCFGVREAPPQNIVLLDDVVTTGSTLHEAAATLNAAGAKKILALAVANA